LTPGARELQLTSDGQGNVQPAWSPDAKLIAFQSRKRGGIWVIPAMGGTARQLSNFGAFPAWSRDHSFIAFQSEGSILPPTTLWTVSLQGGDPIQITQAGNPPGGHSAPSWSPDGKTIVFVASAGLSSYGGQLWTVASTGGSPQQVIRGGSWFSTPVYSLDGDYIYSGGVTEFGNFVLYKLHVTPPGREALGPPTILADTGLSRIQGLTISADGKKLAYNSQTWTSELMSVSISPNAWEATSSPTPLTQSTSYRKSSPIFSRDGRKIAFIQFSGGENQKLWAMDADGRNIAQLTTGSTVDHTPSWFPDNDTIAYVASQQGQQELWSISVSTGRQKLLLDPHQDIGWPRVSPDGKQIAFNSTKGGTINTWTVPVEGGTPRQLTFYNEVIGWPCWSPDGKLLALQMKRGADYYLAVMSSTGGEITQLTFEHGILHHNDWSPDGDKIVFAGLRNGIWNVYWFSRSIREEKQLTHYTKQNEYVRYPSWSPLGNQIVYEYTETTGNIWLMELK